MFSQKIQILSFDCSCAISRGGSLPTLQKFVWFITSFITSFITTIPVNIVYVNHILWMVTAHLTWKITEFTGFKQPWQEPYIIDKVNKWFYVDSRLVIYYFMAILLKQHNNVHSSAQTLIVPQIFHCMCVTENMIIGCFYKLRDKLKLFPVLINHLPQILLITFHLYLPRKIPLITLSLITENSCECSFCKQYFADSLAHLICKSNLVYRP